MAKPLATAVPDTSVIINLAHSDNLRLLAGLFDRVLVPLEVWFELAAKDDASEPDLLLALPNVSVLPVMRQSGRVDLGAGEAAAIALAQQRGGIVLLDERRARRAAKRESIPCEVRSACSWKPSAAVCC